MKSIFSSPGCNTELLNCFEEANDKRRSLNQYDLIAEVLENGDFVLVEHVPYYCKSTDAFAGTYQVLAGIFPTREAAEQALLSERYQDDSSEIRAEVLPHKPVAKVSQPIVNEDIPF